jgi:hypothetical protein
MDGHWRKRVNSAGDVSRISQTAQWRISDTAPMNRSNAHIGVGHRLISQKMADNTRLIARPVPKGA